MAAKENKLTIENNGEIIVDEMVSDDFLEFVQGMIHMNKLYKDQRYYTAEEQMDRLIENLNDVMSQ